METKHSATPWMVVVPNPGADEYIGNASGLIASLFSPRRIDDTQEPGESWIDMRKRTKPLRDAAEAEKSANAAHIVRCVNAFDAMREALEAAGNVLDGIATATSSIPAFMPILEKIAAALALAKEEK